MLSATAKCNVNWWNNMWFGIITLKQELNCIFQYSAWWGTFRESFKKIIWQLLFWGITLNALKYHLPVLHCSVLRPVQTGNVWWPNIIKHCLVTKHADVEVSGQTVKRVWSNTDQTMDTSRWARVECMQAQTCLIWLSKQTKHCLSDTRTKEMF